MRARRGRRAVVRKRNTEGDAKDEKERRGRRKKMKRRGSSRSVAVDNAERTRRREGQGAFSAGGGSGMVKKEDKPAPVPS